MINPPSPAYIPGFDPYGPDETGTDIVYYFSPAEERHNGRANVVFVDGHTESHTLEDLGYVTVSPVPIPSMPVNNSADSAFPDPWPSDGPYPQPTSFTGSFNRNNSWGSNAMWNGVGLDESSDNFNKIR